MTSGELSIAVGFDLVARRLQSEVVFSFPSKELLTIFYLRLTRIPFQVLQ